MGGLAPKPMYPKMHGLGSRSAASASVKIFFASVHFFLDNVAGKVYYVSSREIKIMTNSTNVRVMEVRGGVEVINICDLMDTLDLWGANYDKSSEAVLMWCASNGASYYAMGREDFWVGDAVTLAKGEGKSRVVVEDLS